MQIASPTRTEFDRIFETLSEGAQSVEMAPDDTFWAERFAKFTDRYGSPWMLNYGGNKAQD